MKTVVYLKTIHLAGTPRLAFGLKNNPNLALQFQNISGWCWSEKLGVWHIPYYDNHMDYLRKKFCSIVHFRHVGTTQHRQPAKAPPCKADSLIPQAFYQQMRLSYALLYLLCGFAAQ